MIVYESNLLRDVTKAATLYCIQAFVSSISGIRPAEREFYL